MTEVEKIAYAKSFIDKLAKGINPLDNTPIPDGDVAKNERLSKCFSYVSDILRQVCENGGVTNSKRTPKIPFAVSVDQLERFEYAAEPIDVGEIAKRIYATAGDMRMKPISRRQILQWLLNIGLLYLHDFGGKNPVKRPTQMGLQMGIVVEKRRGRFGEYSVMLYNQDMQRFILDNLDAVMATEVKKNASGSSAADNSEED